MKLSDIFEGGMGSGGGAVKKPKPRPKGNLWFRDQRFWDHDMSAERGELVYHEDEEENTYATDVDDKICYGYWDKKKNGGMTFQEPKPFCNYCHNKKMIRREL